jgi:hypothetical protein
MAFRRQSAVLTIALSCAVAIIALSGSQPAYATGHPAAAGPTWRTVHYEHVRLRVPSSWPVVSLAAHPRTCPLLDRHAVYLGKGGPDPDCPADLLAGKTGGVQILPAVADSPDSRAATRSAVIDGHAVRTNPDYSITHTIIDILPAAGAEVDFSYGSDLAMIKEIQSSLRITGSQNAARSAAITAAPRAAPPLAPQGLYRGAGFDTCAAPSAAAMKSWLKSPYRAIGVYIGGVNAGCAQSNLSSSWLASVQSEGWHYWPFYVGLQADCVDAAGDATIVPADAAAEGKAAANDAAVQAANLGIPQGTPIVYDMEAYANCGQQVVTFLSAWDSQLHVDGYAAGVYESFSNIGDLVSARATMTEPDVINYADWDGKATTTSSYMPAGLWTDHQRLHQYLGGHNQTFGAVALNIDSDRLNVRLGGAVTPPPSPVPPLPFRIALAINRNGTAEWFARAANGSLLHAWQHPIGTTAWVGAVTVGRSPHNLVSNPAVTTDHDGALTLFAVNSKGLVVHAWQQAGFPNEWEWGGPAGSGSPGTITGDPAAIREPDGDVEVFVTHSDGTVAATHQTAPDANSTWTAWTPLGGTCASSPVPFMTGGALAVACVTRTGTLAVIQMSGTGWSAWQQAGQRSGLSGMPAVVTTASGQTDLFAAATAGGLDEVYQAAGSTLWTQAAGLPASEKVQGSPSAIAWPGGGVAVFSQLDNGLIGYAVSTGSGAGSWSAWTSLGAAMLGSPTAWLDTSGEPQAVIVNSQRKLAIAGYSSSTWTPWSDQASGF